MQPGACTLVVAKTFILFNVLLESTTINFAFLKTQRIENKSKQVQADGGNKLATSTSSVAISSRRGDFSIAASSQEGDWFDFGF